LAELPMIFAAVIITRSVIGAKYLSKMNSNL
jgi:hypothetical protein